MKFRLVMTPAFTVLLTAAVYASDISMSVSGKWSDGSQTYVNPGCLIRATFTLTNTSGQPITSWTNGFRVYTWGGSHISYIRADTLPIAWNQYVDAVFVDRFSFDGQGEDTVGFGGFVITRPGFPPGFSEDVWYIELIVEGNEGYLTFDTSFYPPGGAWLWSTPTGDVIPDWSGQSSFQVLAPPCGWTVFHDSATSINVPVNGPFAREFVAANPIDYIGHPTLFDIIDGPGELEVVDDSTCLWHITAGPADLGRTDSLFLQAQDCGACASRLITLTFCEPSLELGPGSFSGLLTLPQGGTGCHDFNIECPGYPLLIADSGELPGGVCSFSGDKLCVSTTAECRGLYTPVVGQTDGSDSAFCPVTVLVTDPVCYQRGNADGKMTPESAVNVADLTYLVNHLFRGGAGPANADEGNVDGVGDIVVSDVTYLVNFLFRGGPEPPACP